MAVKLNSEFNYRYQTLGLTPWEKLKQLKSFLEGRKASLKQYEIVALRRKGMVSEIEYLKKQNAPDHIIIKKEVDLLEAQVHDEIEADAHEKNVLEVELLERLIAEVYEIVEPTRIPGYTDEQMFELNAANEFTHMIGREIYAEIVAVGRPSPAKVRNAMSNPYTLSALKKCGLLPNNMQYIEGNADPQQIELKQTFFNELPDFMGHKMISQPGDDNTAPLLSTGLEEEK